MLKCIYNFELMANKNNIAIMNCYAITTIIIPAIWKHGYTCVHNAILLFLAFEKCNCLVFLSAAGPGCSSVGVGALTENGPFVTIYGEAIAKNDYSWNKGRSNSKLRYLCPSVLYVLDCMWLTT